MSKDYALFDWDNTVHEGYTLFRWIDYLYECGEVSNGLLEKLDRCKADYNASRITHDGYAEFTWKAYEEEIRGKPEEDISLRLSKYFELGRDGDVFPFAQEIFAYLRDCDIDIIIISGAPYMILDGYRKRYQLSQIYAVKDEIHNGRFTGKVLWNTGYRKAVVINKIMKGFGRKAILGFGDSSSDLPIFDAAEHSFGVMNPSDMERIDEKKGNPVFTYHTVMIPNTIDGKDAVKLIRNRIDR